MTTVNSAEFIGLDTVILAGSSQVRGFIYNTNGLRNYSGANIPINTVSFGFSISISVDRKIMAVAHCSDVSEDDSQISFYNVSDGKRLGSMYLPGDRSMRYYRIVNFLSADKLEVITNATTRVYEYTF
jgi:hypothetical protein